MATMANGRASSVLHIALGEMDLSISGISKRSYHTTSSFKGCLEQPFGDFLVSMELVFQNSYVNLTLDFIIHKEIFDFE